MAARIAHVARGETKAMATVSSAKGNTCLGDRSRTKAGAAPTRRNVAATGLGRSFVSSPKHLLHRRLYACGRAAAAVGEAKDVAIDSPWELEDCRLVLSDGSILRGSAFGAKGTAVGEVVFNTALTGYQEILTDPSYAGQFVVFTQPHIGNTGINVDDMESGTQPSNKKQCHLGAIVVRRLSPLVSNYRSNMTLGEYLEKNNVIGIANVDTRALTRKLREGCQVGCISTDASLTDEQLQEKARGWSILGLDLIKTVSTKDVYEWDEGTDGEWEFNAKLKEIVASGSKPFNVVAYDFGIKTNILRRLASFNCKVTVVPCDYPAEKVLELNPEGIFFSNGPGDPSAAPYAVENAKKLLGKAPIFGICMGHQVLGQAFGSPTFKLKFGHHGGNHPIKHKPTGRIEISSQNHNYAVDPAQLPPEVEVTHVNLNDGTCAGMRNATLKAISIQYHPEASPGPHDADVCFEEFIDMMLKARTLLGLDCSWTRKTDRMARSLSLKLTQEAARALACEAAAAFQGGCRSASHRTSVGHRADALEKIRRGFASESAAARTDNTARRIRIRLWSAEAPGTKLFSSQVGKRLGSDVLERLKTQFGKPVPAARELAKQTLKVPSRVARTAQLQVEGIWQQNKWLFIGTFTLVVVYALWRSMFRVASSFINLSETFAEYGFLAFAMALATLGYLVISHRYKIRPSNVYRIAMIRLNSHPGVLEVLGAPVIGSELRAYVLVGGGLKFKNFRLKLRPRRLHMIFPVEGRDHRGMASLEVKKRRGRYDFKLLAVDVPGAEGSKPIFVYGDMDRYNRGGVLAELRDPFLKALDMSGATEAEDEADDMQDSAAEAEEDRGRHADLPKPLDQGGGMYFYEQVWEALHKAFARSLQALQKKREQLSK